MPSRQQLVLKRLLANIVNMQKKTLAMAIMALAICSLFAHNVMAQTKRSAEAVAVVDAAIRALGGIDSLQSIQGWEIEELAPGDTGATTSVVIKIDEKKGEFSRSIKSGAHSTEVTSGHGHPTMILDGQARRVHGSFHEPISDPSALIHELLTASGTGDYSIKLLGTTTIGSSTVTVVEISRPSRLLQHRLSPRKWSFDNKTGLPVRLEYELDADNPLSDSPMTVDFSDFRATSGITIPYAMTFSRPNTPPRTLGITSATLNPTLDPHVFDAVAGESK